MNSECLTNLVKNKIMTENKNVSVLFMVMGVLFCTCLITANILETKQFVIGPVNLTGGLLVFPVSYILNDCFVEVWGYRRARLVIWLGFFMNFLFVAFGALCDLIPGAPYWHNEDGFHQIFGLAPRIAGASFLAFLVGSFLNAYVMSRMKVATNGKGFSARAILSTVVGEGADSLIFFPLALGGVVPLTNLMLMVGSQVILKTLYEVLVLPVTVCVVRRLKRVERVDTYDVGISYKVLG